jgi:TrmH family RNA methyltransferase
MITIRKLLTLKGNTRLRKIASILREAEAGMEISQSFVTEALTLIPEARAFVSEAEIERIRNASSLSEEGVRRSLNTIRYRILSSLGASPGDWDFLIPGSGENGTMRLDTAQRRVFPISVYLEDIRSPFNVGSIFRTSESFGVSRIYISPDTASPLHPRAARTARGCGIPWETAPLSVCGTEAQVFCLELGGECIDEFQFPERGMVIIGSEELGVSPEALALTGKRRVSIPLYGAKGSLNVSVAFGILMYAWARSLSAGPPPNGRGPFQSQAD